MLNLNFNPFPTLSTNRLLLRQITTADVIEIFELRSNKAVMEFINRPLAETTADALQLIKKIIDSITSMMSLCCIG